ncbi:MAG: arginine repressor [Firmicutes bacterium]|nr:arginine repressor [Bacillota bacterium]
MKSHRQHLISSLVAGGAIETQGQLMEALEAAGIAATQATVSRDIKELRLYKELGPEGKYRYAALPERDESRDEVDPRLRTIFREGVVSCACAQNLIVVKTLPGLAQAVCSAVDAMGVEGLLGSVGGDDTAFLAMRDTEAAERMAINFHEMMKGN